MRWEVEDMSTSFCDFVCFNQGEPGSLKLLTGK